MNMNKLINSIVIGFIIISTVINLYFIYNLDRLVNERVEVLNLEPKQIIVDSVKFDTVYFNHFDTIKVETIKKDTITKLDSIFVMDSVEVFIPINTYKFDTTFNETHVNLIFEGFNVQLNSLLIENLKTPIIKEKPLKTNRFGIGLQLGIGATKEGFSPYIGVGLNYRLF